MATGFDPVYWCTSDCVYASRVWCRLLPPGVSLLQLLRNRKVRIDLAGQGQGELVRVWGYIFYMRLILSRSEGK